MGFSICDLRIYLFFVLDQFLNLLRAFLAFYAVDPVKNILSFSDQTGFDIINLNKRKIHEKNRTASLDSPADFSKYIYNSCCLCFLQEGFLLAESIAVPCRSLGIYGIDSFIK